MKKTILFMAVAISSVAVFAQKKTTTSGTIAFDATTTLDALPKAENKTVIAAVDTKNGTILFEALVKSFNFSNPMMQEHFNSPKWFDSDKDPKASFSGTIINLKEVNFNKDGTYKSTVQGDLTLKGISNKVSTVATFEVKGKSVTTNAVFNIKLVDYKISDAKGKVAEEPQITVTAVLN